MKKFETFKGYLSPNFRQMMIEYWIEDEGYDSVSEALEAYGGEDFDELCNMTGLRTFVPDLGYTDDSKDGTLCFESVDNNFCIPVEFIITSPIEVEE